MKVALLCYEILKQIIKKGTLVQKLKKFLKKEKERKSHNKIC